MRASPKHYGGDVGNTGGTKTLAQNTFKDGAEEDGKQDNPGLLQGLM